MTTVQLFRRTASDALVIAYLVVTALGTYNTFTHDSPAFLRPLTRFSYGMLAPYQGDSDDNFDLAVVAWNGSASELVSIHRYIPGSFGEKMIRISMVFIPEHDIDGRRKAYASFFSQALEHERRSGKKIDRFDVYMEVWKRDARSYEENRHAAVRTFLASVR